MYQNPTLAEVLVRSRVAELRRSAEPSVRRRRLKRRRRATHGARQATGWLLVDMGLRLAVPRNAANQPTQW